MQKFAHSVPDRPEEAWEPLSDHLDQVGRRAAGFADAFGAAEIARAMGLLHDIGKQSAAYQHYIRGGAGRNDRRGPDHSSAGAREAFAAYGDRIGKLMGFGIAGHHAGLMDGTRLAERRTKLLEDYSGWRAEVHDLPDLATVQANAPRLSPNAIEKSFSASFFIRMLFSCLVDADFLETEAFYASACNEPPPPRGGVIGRAHVEATRRYMAAHRRDDNEVNRLRSAILDHAVGKAGLAPGLFTLTVPTGGGKTLTSLSFAMEHALIHGARRLIFAIPFTSIIEQAAAVFREVMGPDLEDAVLEHHSSFDPDREAPRTEGDEEREGRAGLAKLRRDAENWGAPIVVTTTVQLFESLFAKRTSKARKLHNLARSVIVIDEAQSLPLPLLRPCLAAIDELARNYGATIILCTATQPALRVQDGALRRGEAKTPYGLDIPDERELAPDPPGLYEKLRRVKVEWLREPVADETLVARFAETPQMLCIVNSRAHARDLSEAIRDQPGAVHLTTLMCAMHRRQVLAKVREDLAAGRPVRLVATSLIEAGVDISFPEVWRAATGLSGIAQAAGRANRSGELGPLGEAFGRTVVFEPAGRKTPPAIEAFYEPARTVLRAHGEDMLSHAAVRDYFEQLYWRKGDAALDHATTGGDIVSILKLISEQHRYLDFPFETIADAFRMIDEVMDPVIIPFDDAARAAIDSLRHADFPPAGVQRRLQQYVVPVPARIRMKLLAEGVLEVVRPHDYGDRFVVLVQEQAGQLPPLYDRRFGLRLDDPAARSAEDNIFS
jgi:CRISPR-associated endonuclease/helicase Cas3